MQTNGIVKRCEQDVFRGGIMEQEREKKEKKGNSSFEWKQGQEVDQMVDIKS